MTSVYRKNYMSKYDKLWEYVKERNENSIILSYSEIIEVSGTSIDHSFLQYKKELSEYGFEVGKISIKNQTVEIHKL